MTTIVMNLMFMMVGKKGKENWTKNQWRGLLWGEARVQRMRRRSNNSRNRLTRSEGNGKRIGRQDSGTTPKSAFLKATTPTRIAGMVRTGVFLDSIRRLLL